jgi:hypothetical protein
VGSVGNPTEFNPITKNHVAASWTILFIYLLIGWLGSIAIIYHCFFKLLTYRIVFGVLTTYRRSGEHF